jgi:predicted CoA-binding protein
MPTTRGQKKAGEMEAALKTFFSSPRFAVAGASSDPTKYGHIGTHCTVVTSFINLHTYWIYVVFAWYLQHSLPVTPLNPRSPTIDVLDSSYTTTASPNTLNDPSSYSLSVITPPAITKNLLKEAREAGVPAVWLQPGSFDNEVLEYARKEFKAAIAGDGGRGGEGWCVLVDGEAGLKIAGREWSKL